EGSRFDCRSAAPARSSERKLTMRTFTQKPKTNQRTKPARSTNPGGMAHFGQAPEVKSILHAQRTVGNQTAQRLPQPEGEEEPEAERGSESIDAPSVVGQALGSSGQPLDTTSRASMESLFGHDLSKVRVHADSAAAASASAACARAYTYGHHIVFAQGRYAPDTPAGRRLLAHELSHVVQQERGAPGSAESLESEAESAERGQSPAVGWGLSPRPQLQLSPERATRVIII